MLTFLRRHTAISGNKDGNRRQTMTDHFLREGPLPRRITRPFDMRFGKVGNTVNTFPPTAGLQYVGHVPTVHLERVPMRIPTANVDDRSHVPALYAGDPR